MYLPIEIEVLFRDDALLVVNKPSGLATLPDGYDPTLPHIKSVLEKQYGPLWIVHRLDKGTSGVLVLARSTSAHRSLNTQFEKRLVSKVYHALVYGTPDWQETTVNLSLRANADRQHRTVADQQNGKPAVTHFAILERFRESCLLQAVPETGRTHQIRAHLSTLGLYIVGDKLYAPLAHHQGKDNSRPSDQLIKSDVTTALHAASLEFRHPLTGQVLKFTAPYPPEFVTLLKLLRSDTNLERRFA